MPEYLMRQWADEDGPVDAPTRREERGAEALFSIIFWMVLIGIVGAALYAVGWFIWLGGHEAWYW